ncbi:TPA: helix-turn-helix transcriptional regulator [Streptococcus equi subsp. zooepidemicus]|uniref:helix-turn-helix domain-containing protein n=1 Tax=Streptococcus equi TaxID=1336 RepID=UPI0005BA1B45|nr:helix-turn-helix transcriptional regulator [Streptococcus equi]KIS06550.1 transcriptional regulator [Streptococcus equi subsp. zooepidemicus Sz5]MCD3391465.1 helix-turn-helix transcriptional regulator [Streptococcus equi subsp. zooepidemicus]MCD3393423.1 helix-turn-helix transcriptional regulator [Streptococcus equi subsp. zooepidemicus]MCD3395979.1 helix-turn-helix transcriptional regulator [Streptococcus equi subsp. zooepidemicus]MCD3408127.1 helix-turn-helix transcriptional regulator [St
MTTLAEKFRLKRKELGLSQQTLAKGICEQSQISKIERGHFIPSADLLFRLSQRLEVPLDYFFNEQIEVKSNLSNFKHLSARLLDDRNYDDLEYLYKIEVERSTFLTLEDRTYLEWIKAIIDFYQYELQFEAISHLENILSKVASTTLIYLKVLNTLSNFYSLVGREEDYEANYSLLMELYQTKNLEYQEFLFGYIRVRYNYAHYLVSKEKYNEAMQEALETIELCKERQTSYQLAPLLVLVGNCGTQFLGKEQVKNYYIEARELCKIYNNPLMLMKIENYLKELDAV